MKQLIITEKPSVAINIANALGVKNRKDGYIENDKYIISWCYGHLDTLANADSYDGRYAIWRKEDLPILPAPWRLKIADKIKYDHFKILKSLMYRRDVTEIVNACDAGREGELIFRNALKLAECKKPVKRLWISSMEDEAIIEGFRNLKLSRCYDNLYEAADCRAKADWLVGINLTRFFSVIYHRTLNVGRVVTPTLALIISRQAEIDAFEPTPYYNIQLESGDMRAKTDKIESKEEAEKILEDCKKYDFATCYKLTCQAKEEKAPLLYDLTSLQRDANKKLGYTTQQTLNIVQTLYEKKLCTYPRTDARYLTSDMEKSIPELINASANLINRTITEYDELKVISNKKVTDHHAIIPTKNVANLDLASLDAGEINILTMIATRLLCAVSEPFYYFLEKAFIRCGDTEFTFTYRNVESYGWKTFIEEESEDSEEPEMQFDIEEGDVFEINNIDLKENFTKSKPNYTEDTLLSAMENAGAKETPEDAERKGLGTPATRAAMIEKLIATGFVQRKSNKKTVSLVPTFTGKSLITVLPEQIQSPLLTAEWEHKLKLIEKGEMEPEDFMNEISEMIIEIIDEYAPVHDVDVLFPSGREIVGKCPRCGGNVTEGKNGFHCEKNECKFAFWKDNTFLQSQDISITKEMAVDLLAKGYTEIKNPAASKTVTLSFTDNGEKVRYRLKE